MRRRPKLVLRFVPQPPKAAGASRWKRIETGTVTKVWPTGVYDVTVGNRAWPFEKVRPIVRMKFRVNDEVMLGFLEGVRDICFILGKAKNISGSSIASEKPTVPLIPLNPGLWLQHDAFWWAPARTRDPQRPFDPGAAGELFLSTGAINDALDRAQNFRGLVAFPDGDDQIVATLTAVYEAVEGDVVSTPFTDDIDFVADGDEDPPGIQVEGRTFQLSHTPDADLEELEFGDGNFQNTPPESLSAENGRLIEYSPSLTYALALIPVDDYTMTVDYLSQDAAHTSRTENFYGDGDTDTFQLFSGGDFYVTNLGASVHGPTQVIASFDGPPTVDGVPDTLATFSGDTVTLSYVPDPGAFVTVNIFYNNINQRQQAWTGNDSNYKFELTPSTDEFYAILAADDGSTDLTPNVFYRASDSCILFLAVFAVDDFITVDYTYQAVGADVFNITGLQIIEKNKTTGISNTLELPLDEPVSAHFIGADGAKIQVSDLSNLGQLFYDPLTSSYTVAGPTGLHWRDRQALGVTPELHHKFLAWPDDGNSADEEVAYNVANFWSILTLARRQAPWYCFHSAGRYGLMGGWNRTGGVRSTEPDASDGYTFSADSAFPIHLFRRNDENLPVKTHSIDVKTLCQNPNPSHPVNVIGCGSTNPVIWQTTNYGRHLMSRNLAAWIVCAGWQVIDWNLSSQAFRASRGWVDAGLTLNAIDPEAGTILAQHTIKCDKNYEIFTFVQEDEDIPGQVAASAAAVLAVIDKYVNNNSTYWPPTSGSVPAAPIIGFDSFAATSTFFEDPPGSNTQWFMIGRFMGVRNESTTTKGYPGVPTFASSPDKTVTWRGGPGVGDDKYKLPSVNLLPDIIGDESNNLYLTLFKPIWSKIARHTSSSNVIDIGGTFTHNWAGQPTPDYAENIFTIISMPTLLTSDGLVSSSPYSVVEPPSYPLASAQSYRTVAWFPPLVAAGTDGSGTPLFTSPANSISITWKSVDHNPAYATVAASYDSLPRPIEYLTFSGYQEVPQPYAGFKVVDYVIDYYWDYWAHTAAQLWLYKVKYDENAKTFSEVWSQDISEWNPINGDNAQRPVPYLTHTEISPRGIFVLNVFFENPYPVSYANIFNVYLRVFLNGTSAPGSTPLQRIALPNSRWNNGDYGPLPTFEAPLIEIDPEGHENVIILHVRGGTKYCTVVTFGDNLADTPSITQSVVSPTDPQSLPDPSAQALKRMVRVSGNFYWDSLTDKIYTKPAATP